MTICGYELKGALDDCIEYYPYFQYDLKILIKEGYVQVTSPETGLWLKSKTSLAEYLNWDKTKSFYVPRGFWAPAEKAFGIKRYSLRRLAGKNANPKKPKESRDFKKLKLKLMPFRSLEKIVSKEYELYYKIRKLIIFAKDDEFETIHEILTEIAGYFSKNVDKKPLIRR